MSAYLTLAEAGKLLPTKRAACTLWRWAIRGFRVGDQVFRLQCAWIGRSMFTTPDWLDEFIQSVSAAQESVRGLGGCLRPRRRKPRPRFGFSDVDLILERAGLNRPMVSRKAARDLRGSHPEVGPGPGQATDSAAGAGAKPVSQPVEPATSVRP